MSEIGIEILPSGHIRFRRGDTEHNKNMKNILVDILGDSPAVTRELDEFFAGSEEVAVLFGERNFCG